jgi:hypothetical protein
VTLRDLGFLVPKQLAYRFHRGATQEQSLGKGVPELVDAAINRDLLEQPGERLAPRSSTVLGV